MSLRSVAGAFALGAVSLCVPAAASTIGTNESNAQFAVNFYEPIGQSFVAVDPLLVSIGFKFAQMNPGFPQQPVRVDLYSGFGTGGTLIASRTESFNAPIASAEYHDFDFSGVSLAVGQQYSAAISIVGDSPNLGVFATTANGYIHGQLFASQPTIASCDAGQCDLTFRVTGVSAAVPEPATWAMMLGGFGLAGAAVRRRAKLTDTIVAAT